MSDDLLNPEKAPEGLKIQADPPAVKRINWVPWLIAGVIVAAFSGGLIYVVKKRADQQKQVQAEKKTEVLADARRSLYDILAQSPKGVIEPEETPKQRVAALKRETRRQVTPMQPRSQAQSNNPPPRLSELEQQRLQILMRLMHQTEEAMMSDMKVAVASNQQSAAQSAVITRGGPRLSSLPTIQDAMKLAGLETSEDKDQNKQAHKEAFLRKERHDHILDRQRVSPLSRFELKAGSVIPAVMISGINSDLPGEIIAQVSQNVYDTATGQYLIIPQGTRLIGKYDSRVAYGQDRVLIAWNRLIFPDGSSIDLGVMAGTDQAGYAGFEDQVNHHYFRIFGSAILMSAISAGAQLSQPKTNQNVNQRDATQTLAAALGQQMGAVSSAMIRKNLNIQPTIEIRPGYRFNVLVNKDMVFQEPYFLDG